MKRVSLRLKLPEWAKTPLTKFVDQTESIQRFMTQKWLYDGDESYYLIQYWGDQTVIEESWETGGMMIDFEIHSGPEDSFYVYSHEEANSRDSYFLEVLQEFGVFFDLPNEYPVNDDEQRIRLIGDHSGLQGMIESFPEEIGITVERLDTFGAGSNRTVPLPALTSRQQEAVTVACEIGYYDVPRTGSMDDIASRLGCTKSTASQILRRAESSVMDAMKE